MNIIEALLTALSLCADCFAVSICSGTGIRPKDSSSGILKAALAFAVIQTGLLVAGWLLGNAFISLVSAVSGPIGCVLLLYVGGSMIHEALKGKCEAHDLGSWKSLIVGGLATSIDALAVGGAESMKGSSAGSGIVALAASVFAVTALSVVAGLRFGSRLGMNFGKWAEIAGGAVLCGLGISMLF